MKKTLNVKLKTEQTIDTTLVTSQDIYIENKQTILFVPMFHLINVLSSVYVLCLSCLMFVMFTVCYDY